jgi:hypothetical protein
VVITSECGGSGSAQQSNSEQTANNTALGCLGRRRLRGEGGRRKVEGRGRLRGEGGRRKVERRGRQEEREAGGRLRGERG